jgi:acyl-CoA synthetase (AMP-forming)/AMP-acid ligase II
VCTRGYHVMTGYFRDPGKTAAAIDADGWLHTGDLAAMDERGYCQIAGRLKDMIIRGGENIYPREIEQVLFGHPAVADVAVVGVPTRNGGSTSPRSSVLRPVRLPTSANCSRTAAARPALLSTLRGPGTHTRDPIHPDVGDVPGRRVVHWRKADIGTKIGAGESLEEFGSTSLGDAGSAVDDQVFVQAHGVTRVGLDGQRDPAVVADIAYLAVLGEVARHDLVPV